MIEGSLLEAAEGYARERLSDKRLGHTLRVADTAERLARLHGFDPEKSRLSALLHDSAREIDKDEMLRIAGERGLPVNDLERDRPMLLHGPVAAELAGDDLGVEDGEVLEAVRVHTTGAPGMDGVPLVLYVADKVEPGREGEWFDDLRDLAQKNLREAATAALGGAIARTEERGRPTHPRSLETLEWLKGAPRGEV